MQGTEATFFHFGTRPQAGRAAARYRIVAFGPAEGGFCLGSLHPGQLGRVLLLGQHLARRGHLTGLDQDRTNRRLRGSRMMDDAAPALETLADRLTLAVAIRVQ